MHHGRNCEEQELSDRLEQISLKLEVCEDQISKFHESQNVQTKLMERAEEDEDIVPEIESGDQIQLESYRSIPTFSGVRGTYRPWRNQVVRRMKMIDSFRKHPKYEAALGIIRSKIVGHASDILTNNRTAYNIVAIIKTLDFSFADKRPLYVVEAEMTSIKQLGKTLHEFYDAISHALNLVIHKIALDYRGKLDHQEALVDEAQLKAVRAFIIGLKSQQIRHILYGRTPGTLAEAFAIAQTVYYDHQHLQLDQCNNRTLQRPFSGNNQNLNQYKPNITETTKMNDYKQANWRQANLQFNTQNRGNQKINQLGEQDLQQFDEELEPGKFQQAADDLISISSHISDEAATSSAFLEE